LTSIDIDAICALELTRADIIESNFKVTDDLGTKKFARDFLTLQKSDKTFVGSNIPASVFSIIPKFLREPFVYDQVSSFIKRRLSMLISLIKFYFKEKGHFII
jgi:hypothetical protein